MVADIVSSCLNLQALTILTDLTEQHMSVLGNEEEENIVWDIILQARYQLDVLNRKRKVRGNNISWYGQAYLRKPTHFHSFSYSQVLLIAER